MNLSKFKVNVYYKGVSVFQSCRLGYDDAVIELNDIVNWIYDFNNRFGDFVYKTYNFVYFIEEVKEVNE